jgi:hypothetical protein
MLESFLERFSASPELPYELLAYERFLAEGGALQRPDAYLFFEPRLRFSLEPDDQPVALNHLRIDAGKAGAVVVHPPTRAAIPVPELDAATAERILSSLGDGRSLLGAQHMSGCTSQQFDRFIRATLGLVVFAPRTIERFEARISGTEIIRFVGSPYEIQRAYWSNMADCRDRIHSHLLRTANLEDWLSELRILHVVSLLGADGRCFYRPQSPLGQRDARPGALFDTATRTLQESCLTLFIDGPRVSAGMVGGRAYHELLCHSVDDLEGLAQSRTITDSSGIDWGHVCVGLARSDPAPAAWFCPPRPMTTAHFACLHGSFIESVKAIGAHDEPGLCAALADFHWQFVRLHPFRCANQSLSMNIVNALCAEAKLGRIPHLLLDQFALRLSLPAYRRIFLRAMQHWPTSTDSSLERWRTLGEKRLLLDRFVNGLKDIADPTVAEDALKGAPEGARLALLLD